MNEDFIDDQPVEVDIKGRKFKIKELTGEEFDQIVNQYIRVENDKMEIDLAKKNRELLKAAVVDAPYEIKGGAFKGAHPDARVKLLQKLKPAIRTELLKKINELQNIDEDAKKK